MRKAIFGGLYMALALVANPVMADTADLEALREGTLKKLVFSQEGKPVSSEAFLDVDGNSFTLADYEGKHVVLNFWATWCAPCRAEMPQLDALQEEFGGDNFAVVTIATGRNPLPGIQRFFAENDIDDLPILLDPKQTLARDMGAFGLPLTVLVDPDGMEIARMRGDAEWYSESARAIISTWIEQSEPDA